MFSNISLDGTKSQASGILDDKAMACIKDQYIPIIFCLLNKVLILMLHTQRTVTDLTKENIKL